MKVEDKKTLLLVEDEVILAMSEKMALEKYGYSVITVTTGEEAVEVVKSTSEIDLILMDIDLGPGIDGTEAAEQILKDRDIPVVFLSSHIEPEIVEKTEKITSYGYVVKSSSITVLDASIKMAFKLFDAYKAINQQNMLIKAGNENLRVTIEELETGKNRLTSVFRAAPIGIGVVINRIMVEINQRMCEMTGYQEEELIGRTARVLYPTQEDFDFVGREKYAQIKLKGTCTVETRWKCKDGEIIDVLLSSTPLDTNDYEKGVTFTALDITERKQAYKQLEESEKRYHEFYDNSPLGYQSLNAEGCFVEANQTLCNLMEYEHEQLIGKCFSDILSPESAEIFRSNFPKFIETGIARSLSYDMVTRNGNIIPVEIDGCIGYDNNEHFKQTHCVIQDVSAQKQLQHNLETNLHYLTKAQEIGKIGTWELELQKNILSWTDEEYKIFGIPLGTEMNYELFLNCVHPDDRNLVDENWKASFNNTPYDIEFRIIVNDKVKWIREKAEFKFDKKGNPISAIGVTQDITERKLVKQIEDETTANLISVISNRKESIWSIDTNYNYIILNDFFKDKYKRALNVELSNGMNALNTMPPDHVELWKSKYDEVLSGKEVVFEHTSIIDNKLHFYEVSLNPIITNNEVTGATALSINITNQVEKEQIALKRESLLNAFTNALPDVSLILNEDGEYIEVLCAFDSLLYAQKEEMVGKYIYDILPKDIAIKIHKIIRKTIETGKSQELEYYLSLQSGETWLQGKTSLMKEKINGKNTIAWIARDITDRKQAEALIKKQLLEKEIILKESHHRIKNNFTTIGSLLSLQANSSDNPEVQSSLNTAIGRVKGLSVLYEKLLLSDNFQTTSVKEYLNNLVDDIINLLSNKQNLTIKKQVDAVQLNSKQLFPIGLIVNELLTNIIKYAFIPTFLS